ncbi:MAG: hypothetical protein BECKG1743E_GA0114224_101606, partial [Candidatus Kentron sp. G]
QVSSDHERYPADVKCLGFLYLYVGRYPRNNASRNSLTERKTRRMHNEELFTDGLIGLGIEAGLVRMDFGALSATQKDDKGNSVLEHRQRVVMSTEGFLQTFRTMTGLLAHLEKTGQVVRDGQPAPGDGAVADDTDAGEAQGSAGAPRQEHPARSPNFR